METKSMNSYDIKNYTASGKGVAAGWSVVVFLNVFLYLACA